MLEVRDEHEHGILVFELIVGSEHRLSAEDGGRNDAVDVEEQLRESAREVCQEALRHCP